MLKRILRLKWLIVAIAIGGGLLFTSSVNASYEEEEAFFGRINENRVRIRSTATLETDDNILFLANRGQILEILDFEGDFFLININGLENVFVFREFVDILLVEEDDLDVVHPYVPTNVLADEFVAFSKTLLGVPYRFGSADPARGFDCSGFVTYVANHFNISLQRSSASMAAVNGFAVSRGELLPGDLVFFATGGGSRISHVGIYIGDSQFIHSATARRRGVSISSLNESYFNSRYVTARRIL
ncbi:MAG: C40 family peptidase [Turicibacter sp.]|nr:C40 family peptidase [Turicibacter sp.]